MTTTAELLEELSTLDDVTAYVPTCKDQDAGMVPAWCELVLTVKRVGGEFPLNMTLPLRRHDGELIIEVLHQVLHPAAGGAVTDGMWADLDAVVDRIQRRIEKGKDPLKRDVGEALGLATGIARMINPYDPDIDEVREVAMERYEIRNSAVS